MLQVKLLSASPLPAFSSQIDVVAAEFDAMAKPLWLQSLAPEDSVLVWTAMQLVMSCDYQVACGNRIVGHVLSGGPLLSCQISHGMLCAPYCLPSSDCASNTSNQSCR
jgi:hypothetical protein